MKVMDTLSDVYREVCLLRLKYEHLTDVCKTLLKPWPNYDASGRLIKDAGKEGETTTTEEQKKGPSLGYTKNEPGDQKKKGGATAKVPHEGDEEQPSSNSTAAEELQLLDEILSRAQKLRAIQPSEDGVSTRKSSFAARSTKLAVSVYKPRARPESDLTGKRQKTSQSKLSTATRSKQPSSSTSRRTVGSSQRTARAAGMSTTSISRGLCSQAKKEPKGLKAKSLPDLPQLVPTHSQIPSGMSHIRSDNKDVAGTGHETVCLFDQQVKSLTKIALCDEHEESYSEPPQGKSDRFSLRLYGTRLAMPSKYHRLHNALAKLNENCGSQAAEGQCSATAEHFSQRLVPKETACCAKAIQLQLVQEGFSLLEEQVTSITPQEWAVSDRSSWQEVLRIKSKLDFITEQTHHLQQELKDVLSTPSPPPPPSGPEQGATSHTRPVTGELEPVEPFVYSSLKDWHAMAKVAHYRQLYAWEAEMLSFCEQIILPRAAHVKHTDRSFSAILQSVYEILGMDTKPLFLSVELPPHQQLQLEPN